MKNEEVVEAYMPPQVKELRNRKRIVVGQMEKLFLSASGRGMTNDEEGRFDSLEREAKRISSELDGLPTRVAIARDQHGGPLDTAVRTPGTGPTATPEYRDAFEQYIRRGRANMSGQDSEILQAGWEPVEFGGEQRAQSVGVTTEGGFAVPDSAMLDLDRAMLSFGGLLSGPIRKLTTASGSSLPIPTNDDTGNPGVLLAENTQASTVDAVFSQVVLNSYKFTSGLIRASNEFLQDANIDVVGWATEMLGERLARGLAPYLIDGDGVAEPGGLDLTTSFVTAAAAGAITRQDILDLIHTVDPAYRNREDFRLVFNDLTLKAVKELSIGSGDDRPLYLPSAREGSPETIEGAQFIIDQGVSDIGGGNRSIYAGALSKFILRQAGPVRILVLKERFADFDQLGLIGFARWDSDLLQNSAFAVLRHPTS